MTIDIDRLHKVVEGKLTGRRCGKTFALICELAGVMETSDKDIVIGIINYNRDKEYLGHIINEVFSSLKIDFEFSPVTGVLKAFGKKALFKPIEIGKDLEAVLRGYNHCPVVDFRYNEQNNQLSTYKKFIETNWKDNPYEG